MRRALGLPIMLAPFATAPTAEPVLRDGQHDFDREIGTWTSEPPLLQNPPTGTETSTEYEGTTVARSETVVPPVVRRFDQSGHSEFFRQDEVDGRRIRVPFVITPVDRTTWHFEEAFSADTGVTWETNWIVTDNRVSVS